MEGAYEYNSDSEGREDEDKPPLRLDNIILVQRLKQNDSGVTNLSVSISDEYFNSIDWKVDGDCIANNKLLKKLLITYHRSGRNILGEEGRLPTQQLLQEFFSCIYRNSSIEVLVIDLIKFDEFGGGLVEGLCGHPSITKLKIGHSILGSIGYRTLGRVLKHPKSKLKELRLPWCDLDCLSVEEICYLTDALSGNKTLKKLCLNENSISTDGWRVLSTVLQHPNCK